MKPLILMLLFVISAEAQTIADVARKERERKANLQSVQVITADSLRTVVSAVTSAEPAKPVVAATPAPAAAPAPSQDAIKKYAEELARLRTKAVQLQDLETSLQLQMNDVKNQVLSPVTDATARSQAQAKMDQVQTLLSTTQKDLVDTRRTLQLMEAQGPPKAP